MVILSIIFHLILYYFIFERAEQSYLKNMNLFWILFPLVFIAYDIYALWVSWIKKTPSDLIIHLSLLVLIPTMLSLGHLSWKKAFQDCLDHSEQVRLDIIKYHHEHGGYPSIKHDFPIKFCGNRFLNGPLLLYEETSSGFKIFFSDNFVTYIGTESEEVTAFK